MQIQLHEMGSACIIKVLIRFKARNYERFIFPVELYLSDDTMSAEDILRKFEDEFMELPPCISKQITLQESLHNSSPQRLDVIP